MKDQTQKPNNGLIPAEQKFFSQMIEDYPNIKVDAIGTKEGFKVVLKIATSRRYILHTQRNAVRCFKSPSTLFSFLSEIGVTNITVKDLHLCGPDRYVTLNKDRHKRRLKSSKHD